MIYQLSGWFVCTIVGIPIQNADSRIRTNISSIQKLVKDGWELEEIQAEIEKFAQDYPDMVKRIYMLEEIFATKKPPKNIMNPDIFYYHNRLRETSPAPKMRKGPDGKYIQEVEPFFLEMKKRFTMEELLEYWYEKMNIQSNPHMIKQDEGKFNYLLGIYDLDEILFAIDEAKRIRLSWQRSLLRNAFDIEKYVDEARETISQKKNIHQIHGINRVIRKQVIAQ
ncbi:hypothetical protein TCA2_4579 [Paenibacillus sp. TCA20]|nr:hypothetical protein TCA2_4579 [Paenibacillus sp. TCA20]